MKTILINIHDGYFVRNFFRTSTFSILKNEPGVRLVFLAPQGKIEYYRKEFGGENVLFDILPDLSNSWVERVFLFIEKSSIHTHTTTMLQRSEFLRQQSFFMIRYVTLWIGRFFWYAGRFSCWRRCIRAVYCILPSKSYDSFFERYSPDLVYCPSLLYEDYSFVKEAKKRNLPTIGAVLSWDNFYSKTLLRVHPTKLIAYTDTIAKQAVSMADYDLKNIIITGLPQYDRYFNKVGIEDRDTFCKLIGADPEKKLIVYAFSGKVGLGVDFEIVRMISEAIKHGYIKNAELMIRPYPRYDFTPEKLKRLKEAHGVIGKASMGHVGVDKDNWEFDEDSLVFLTNTLFHADVVVSLYSTFFIEGAIFNKPLVAVGFDPQGDVVYEESARRFFDWDHLREIKDLHGISIVSSEKDLVPTVLDALVHPEKFETERKKIVLRQSQYVDGRSGDRLANAILSHLV